MKFREKYQYYEGTYFLCKNCVSKSVVRWVPVAGSMVEGRICLRQNGTWESFTRFSGKSLNLFKTDNTI